MEENLYPELPILAVDDEEHILNSFKLILEDFGFNNLETFSDPREAYKFIKSNKVSMILLDLTMPYISGEDFLKIVSEEYPGTPVITVTGNNEVDTVIQCLRFGVYDYILKPVEKELLINSVEKALEVSKLRNENRNLRTNFFSDELKNPEVFNDIITFNKKMKSLFRYMEAIKNTSEPVLITGETGTGKELLARAFHQLSRRKGKFIPVNIAGLDDQMFSDTLFGHKKGAFSGALNHREGLIEKARGGTVFLDEIGDLSMESQVKLLRLLQEGEYYPLGSDIPKYTDVLIVAATNQDLEFSAEKKKFRKDLFFRLNVHRIDIPPLRERKDDIKYLTDFFMEKASENFSKKSEISGNEVYNILKTYDYPGNVREFRSIIFDAAGSNDLIDVSVIKEVFERKCGFRVPAQAVLDRSEEIIFPNQLPSLKEVQEILISEALERTEGNISEAASLLGVTRQALSQRLKRLEK